LRFLLHGLIFLLAVASGMAAAVPGLVERVGRRVQWRVEQATGLDVRVARASWTLGGRVTLEGVTARPVDAPAGEPPLLTVRRLSLEGDVIWGAAQVVPRRVELTGGVVNLVRRADGEDNVRRALRGLRDLASGEAAGDAGGTDGRSGGGLGRFLVPRVPDVVAGDLTVSVEAKGVTAPLGMGLPTRVVLSGGTLHAENTALVREDDNLTVKARFADTTLDPGHGLEADAVVRLRAGARGERGTDGDGPGRTTPVSVRFDRPVRLLVGSRVLAVGSARWDGVPWSPVEVADVALSVPLTADERAGDAPVDPAVTVGRVVVVPDPVATPKAVAAALARRDGGREDRLAAAWDVIASLQRVELDRPALVFERRPEGHNFVDLVGAGAGARTGAAEDDAPDKDLGPLMEATRAAARRLLRGRAPADGAGFRGFLVRGFQRLDGAVARLSRRVQAVGRRVPFHHLVVREGRFVWRDAELVQRAGGAERLENFSLDVVKKGALLEFETSFVVPGVGNGANKVDGRVHLTTGDTQIRAQIDRLSLYPYRQVFPKSLPVAESTSLHDTDVTLAWSPASDIARLDGEVHVEDLAFRYKALAHDTLTGIDLGLRFSAQLDRANKTFVMSPSALWFGKLRGTVRFDVERYDSAPKLSGAVRLDRARCQDIVDSIPSAFIPMLHGLRVEGTLAWHLDFSLDTRDMDTLRYESFPALHGFRVLDIGDRLNLAAVQSSFLHRIEEADGTVREMLVGPGTPNWVPLSRVSPYLVKAVTTTEDGSFFRHKGFSTYAIRQSLVANLKKGAFVRGASTITQQVVKNLFLSREKTISRKLQELFITWQIEKVLSKERILELYLNIIEWGPGIYGIRRAARHYFGKEPADLTALEAVFLASIIPSPRRYYRQFSRGQVTEGWRRHLRWIMKVMVERGKLTPDEYKAAWPYSPVFRGQEAPAPTDGPADARAKGPADP